MRINLEGDNEWLYVHMDMYTFSQGSVKIVIRCLD